MIDILYNISAFFLIITVIVYVHEFGHYYIAKLAGVKIEVFSIGFGPEIFGWYDKHKTRWRIALIPLGGYVKMFGDKGAASTPDNEKIKKMTKEEKKIAFYTKSIHWRMAIVAAGPIANYLLAIMILSFFFSYYGIPISQPLIDKVEKHSAAAKAGLKPGDLIKEIDNEKIDNFSDIHKILSINNGEELNIIIERNGKVIEKKVKPELVEKKDVLGNSVISPKLGISSGMIKIEKLSIYPAISYSIIECYKASTTTLQALGQMLIGKRNTDDLGGPLRIAKYSGQSAKKGINVVLWFMAILSINLGLINLLPVPMLDGGHIFYYLIELLRGKPVSEKYQQIGFQIGLILLIMLFIFATFNDLKNLKIF